MGPPPPHFLFTPPEAHAARHRRWRAMMETLAGALHGVPGEVALHGIASEEDVPTVTLTLPRNGRLAALDLIIALQNGSPPIHLDPLRCDQGMVIVNRCASSRARK